MTNFEKVKEMMRLEDSYNGDNPFCDAVGRLKQEEGCTMFCDECYEWLKQEYKEPILTDKEREYLSAVIKPFRDRVQTIRKTKNEAFEAEYIIMALTLNHYYDDHLELPFFREGEYYKNMEVNKEYTLEELGL